MLVAQREGTVQTHGAGVGMTRTITVGDERMLERLEEVDETNWRMRYSMLVTGPFPVADYQATISLTELGPNRCALDWVGSFIPSDANARDAAAAVRAASPLTHQFGGDLLAGLALGGQPIRTAQLPATCLIDRIVDLHAEFFQQSQGGLTNLG
jgi:hypothetical protein